ncbi:lysozyme [Pseudoalteromonas phage Pq0]|uniref:lysozyme n=1 Tax=Pseudoalteromonas phage Pq0 TaxID=1667322 RepID=UPI000655F49E|nr:lysozyme [Pseudoalteromonas phage Pq0]AKN44334.1 lysozyme [Pseudoalteromonas phage Pq0]
MNKQKLVEQLEVHEGLRLKPYRDIVGKLTLGIGRNLEDKGITQGEARMMLNNDIDEFVRKLELNVPVYNRLSDCRQNVLVNMAFNMGIGGLKTFVNMLNFLNVADYHGAAKEMLNSKWAVQVGNRALELAEQMRTDEYK